MSHSGKIKLAKVILEREKFDKMSPKDKKRYIMLTFMLQDLNLLQKCFLYSKNNEPSEGPLSLASNIIHFFFLRILISKIYEMWTFLNRNKILDDHPTFSCKLKAKRDEVLNFFSDEKVEKIFCFIRNKFGFHYEYRGDVDPLIEEAMNSFDQFEMWGSMQDSVNEIFTLPNAVTLRVIFSKMSDLRFAGNDDILMNKIFQLAFDGARIFREFTVSYIAEALPIEWPQKEQIEEIEIAVPLISEVHLPLIVKVE